MPCSKSLKFNLSPDTRYEFGGNAIFGALAFPPETWANKRDTPYG
jgi:hypothetical protein